jgi:integrase
MDSSYLRYYHFYNQTGMRPTEPFIGELVGDWYLISGEDRKNGIPMQMQLNEELKSILLEMQSFRDTKLHCKDANVRVVDILERTVMRIVRALEFTGKRLTLYSFRHSYAIRRVTMADIFTVQRELGHKSTDMTQKYLRFPEQRRLDDFPSLRAYIENRQNMQKNTIRATKSRATEYSNLPKLDGYY